MKAKTKAVDHGTKVRAAVEKSTTARAKAKKEVSIAQKLASTEVEDEDEDLEEEDEDENEDLDDEEAPEVASTVDDEIEDDEFTPLPPAPEPKKKKAKAAKAAKGTREYVATSTFRIGEQVRRAGQKMTLTEAEAKALIAVKAPIKLA